MYYGMMLAGRGATAPTITITNQSVTKTNIGTATASYNAESDGEITKNAAANFLEDWIDQPSRSAEYQIMATLSSGTSPSGSLLGTWLALSSDRSWSVSATSTTVTCTLTIDISDVATSTIRDSATVSITATGVDF